MACFGACLKLGCKTLDLVYKYSLGWGGGGLMATSNIYLWFSDMQAKDPGSFLMTTCAAGTEYLKRSPAHRTRVHTDNNNFKPNWGVWLTANRARDYHKNSGINISQMSALTQWLRKPKSPNAKHWSPKYESWITHHELACKRTII